MTDQVPTVSLPGIVRTPLERFGPVWFKSEWPQPTGSVKDRLVAARIAAGLEDGRIGPATTLLEATAGSTGVALAAAGSALGLPVEIHAYETASPSKLERMRFLGARLELHPPRMPMPELLAAVRARSCDPDVWWLGQYDREALVEAYRPMASELIEQISELGGRPPTRFVCPVGTGGLIQGLGGPLRAAFPGLKIVAVEPAPGVAIDGLRNTRLHHLGPDDPFDPSFPDERHEVDAPGPVPRDLAGRILGPSAAAALRLATRQGWGNFLLVAPE